MNESHISEHNRVIEYKDGTPCEVPQIAGVTHPTAEENCRMVFQRVRFQTDLVVDKPHLLGNASPTFKELMAHHVMQAKFLAMAKLPSYDLRSMFKRMGMQIAS